MSTDGIKVWVYDAILGTREPEPATLVADGRVIIFAEGDMHATSELRGLRLVAVKEASEAS